MLDAVSTSTSKFSSFQKEGHRVRMIFDVLTVVIVLVKVRLLYIRLFLHDFADSKDKIIIPIIVIVPLRTGRNLHYINTWALHIS